MGRGFVILVVRRPGDAILWHGTDAMSETWLSLEFAPVVTVRMQGKWKCRRMLGGWAGGASDVRWWV